MFLRHFGKRHANLGLIVLSSCVALLLAEVSLRLFFPQPTGPVQFAWDSRFGVTAVPGQRATRTLPGVYSFSHSNNSWGFRGPRDHTMKKTTVERWLFLGDSFTYGLGVNDDAVFAEVVQRTLVENGRAVEVVNAGVCGTGTEYALNLFEQWGASLKPAKVCLFFFANDFEDNSRHDYYELDGGRLRKVFPKEKSLMLSKRWLRRFPIYGWLIAHSHLANLFKKTYLNRAAASPRPVAGVISYRIETVERPVRPALEYTQALLSALEDRVSAAGAELVLFLVAGPADVSAYRESGSGRWPELFLAEWAQQAHVRFVSLAPSLAATGYPNEELFITGDNHWTERAHRIAAEAILATLEERVPSR